MIELAIIIAGFIIADAIMFCNGYKGYLHAAKTPEEKFIRAARLKLLERESGMDFKDKDSK